MDRVLSRPALLLAAPLAHAQTPAQTAARPTAVQEVVVTATPFGVAEDALTGNVDVLT